MGKEREDRKKRLSSCWEERGGDQEGGQQQRVRRCWGDCVIKIWVTQVIVASSTEAPLLLHPTSLFLRDSLGAGRIFLHLALWLELVSQGVYIVCFPLLSCVWLFVTPWTVAHQAPLSMGFSRQKYWSRLPIPTPGDFPDPGIKPTSLVSCTSGAFFTTSHRGSPGVYVEKWKWRRSVVSDSLWPCGL